MKIAVIGTGYVGLVTGTCFAESGNEVTCVDKDERKIDLLESGGVPIYEPGLTEMVQRNRQGGRLYFTTSLREGIQTAQLIFIAVGTPQAENGAADLSTVWAVADALGEAISGPKVVVIKSTVPVGTNREVARRIAARCPHPVDVASNPEFLKEGAAIEDCMRPDRVVVGVRRPEVAELLHDLYAAFLRTERPFLVMSPESAEMTKYAANAMLATKISYINEMANLCERVGADINDVRRGIGHDARIGFQFLFPGAGYGGSCFEAGETLLTVGEDGGVRATSFETLFTRVAARAAVAAPVSVGGVADDAGVALIPPSDDALRVLAYDLTAERVTAAQVHALTRRPYRGEMVRIRTSMGRQVRVTADHPVILWDEGQTRVVPAADVRPGDRMALASALPDLASPGPLDLIELLADTALEPDVLVAPTDDSFTAQYERFGRFIPWQVLRHPLEIKDHNRMRLRLFRALRDRGLIDVAQERLRLYTAKGAGARLNARIPIDADLSRLCGYYLAEGFISRDRGRADALRERIGFCFHSEERCYIDDVQRILRQLGLKFIEKTEGKSHTTLVSSRLLAWLLRDIFGCGVRSEDKALPRFAFQLSAEHRLELIRGAFSGDGAVTPLQGGRNLMFEYATVSKRLADGMALLLQSVGVVPSIRSRWMNKSKRPAYLIRVSGYEQIRSLCDVFGAKHRDTIDRILAGYQNHIRQRGFQRWDSVAIVAVRSVECEQADTTVYSLETSTATVVVGSGLVVHNCFPKDIRAIMHMSQSFDAPTPLMEAVDRVNEAQKQVLVQKIRQHYGPALGEKTLAVWGLAFKPRTDDIREAPALVLIDALLAAGANLRVHDPEAMSNVRAIYGDRVVYCDRPYGALEGADGLAIVTEWQQFRNPDFELMRRLLREAVVFDGRNLYEGRTLAEAGFTYHSIGRATVRPAAR